MPSKLAIYLLLAAIWCGMGGTIYALHLKNKATALERDAAVKAELAYKDTLEAYQKNFAAQVDALNSEKRREIKRQENVLRELNMIGDLDETKLPPVPADSLRVIDSLYGQ